MTPDIAPPRPSDDDEGELLGLRIIAQTLPRVTTGLALVTTALVPFFVPTVPGGAARVLVAWVMVVVVACFASTASWSRRDRPIEHVAVALTVNGSVSVLATVLVTVVADRPEFMISVAAALVGLAGFVPQRRLVYALCAASVVVLGTAVVVHALDPAWVLCMAQLGFGVTVALLVQSSRRQPLTRLAVATAALQRFALTDELTGLHNRRGMFEMAARLEPGAAATGVPVPVIFVDVDGLKGVNDSLGHTAGDELIRAAAGVLAYCAGPGDVVARIGGDEFVLVLGHDDMAGTVARIEHQVAAVNGHRRPVRSLGRGRAALSRAPQNLSLSVGTSLWHPPVTTLVEVLDRADKAMYEAKRSRRDVSGPAARLEA